MNIDIKNIELYDYLQELLGAEFIPFLHSAPESPAIRINRLKTSRLAFLKYLNELGQSYQGIPFNHNGLILERDDLPLSHTLAFFTGKFQYQGVSSQVPVKLLNIKPGEKVLDMAASPGSKSGQIADQLQQKGLLVLNDSSLKRMQPLNVNMQKSGAINHYTLKLRGERLGMIYPDYFDKVLIDAPCTALGTLAKNQEIRQWWSLAKLRKLNHIQDHLLIAAYKSLKVGGEMVYATCSVAPEENELIVQRLIEKYPVSILEPPENLAGRFTEGYTFYKQQRLHPHLSRAVRIYPHRHQMEGFFATRLRKEYSQKIPAEKDLSQLKTLDSNAPEIFPVLHALSQTWGINPEIWQDHRYLLTRSRIWMMSREIEMIPRDPLVSAGLLLAEKRLAGWKLVNGSVQYFRKKIQKRCLEIEQEDLIRLFYELSIPFNGEKGTYYILAHRGEPIASLYSNGSLLHLRSSHRYRLVI